MCDLNDIKSYIEKETASYHKDSTIRDMYLSELDDLNTSIKKEEELKELNQKTAVLLKTASQHARKQSINIIEELVTGCLQYIFQNKMRFIIEDKELNKRPALEFYVTDEFGDEKYLTRPEESRGGGIVDIVSLGLRIAIFELLKSKLGGPIVFDEPAKYVSADYINKVAEFLSDISKQFNRQIIMVTHDEYLSNIGDKIYRVELVDGTSRVDEIQQNK